MKLQLVRHATLRLDYHTSRILVDPMLSPAGAMSAVPNTPNQRLNPLVDLPMDAAELLDADAILITHTHRDHLDDAAIQLLPKHLPVFCQPEDEEKLKGYGFADVQPIDGEHRWRGIVITRTGGQHGTGEIGRQMGPVSGFVLAGANEPTLYIAGDTIWCSEVERALERHRPDVTVVFAGAAQFLTSDPITMTAEDIHQVAKQAPQSSVIVAHMETWNHCLLSRSELKAFISSKGLADQVVVPENGEWLEYTGKQE